MDYKKQIDYSSLSTYLDCPRKFFFQYILHMRSHVKSIDLVFGSAWHYGLEITYRALMNGAKLSIIDATEMSRKAFNLYWLVEGAPHFPDPDIIFPKSPGHAANMFHDYWTQFLIEDKKRDIIGVEIPFSITIDPDLPSYIGRKDLAWLEGDQLSIIDHKTTKSVSPITLPGFVSSMQSAGYITAGKMYFDKLPHMIYNVALCQKSRIAFERFIVMLRDAACERFLEDLAYHMRAILDELLDLDADLAEHKNHKLYNPQSFKRCPGYACTQYFRLCPYFDICQMRNNPLLWIEKPPTGYTIDEWHPEEHDAKITKMLEEASKKGGV
jgi:hypothetical protein